MDLNLGRNWCNAIFGVQFCMVLKFGTLWEVDQRYLESFEMWCWRNKGKISWTSHINNKEVLHTVKEERNVLLH